MISFEARGPLYAIEERERFLREISAKLPGNYVLLATCGRVELYTSNCDPFDEIELRKNVQHLFRVVSGLDSPLFGEAQIIAQVRESYVGAQKKKSLDKALHLLFQNVLRVGKRVRYETKIGAGALSHAQVAADIIRERFPDLSEKKITLIGVHNLNNNVLSYLVKRGAKTIFLGNRTYEKALALGKKFGCSVFHLARLEEVLENTDILVSATSAPHYIVPYEKFPKHKKMMVIDLAVPRDIDPRIETFPLVDMYNVSDVESYVKETIDQRQKSCVHAEAIIQSELDAFIPVFMKKMTEKIPSHINAEKGAFL
jgi:glutamyl-tRNA reductase